MMKAPERVETKRLVLRIPAMSDAEAIFSRYASDPEVTKYLSWPRHQSLEDTHAFLQFSESEWSRWPAGAYLVESRTDQRLLGSTGMGFESMSVAVTGYVLAKDSWGRGYATEAPMAVINIAQALNVLHLYALCHPDQAASIRVLDKCGFHLEDWLEEFAEFPNLNPGVRTYCLRYYRAAVTLG
jgi:ribosomal-protein-alanine N-acetyltransferase